jgi:hypothetical protein
MSILDMDIDGLIFETFAWNFHHACMAGSSSHVPGVQHPYAAVPLPGASGAGAAGPSASGPSAVPTRMQHGGDGPSASGANTPTKAQPSTSMPASPFGAMETEDSSSTSIPLKPGGTHLKVRAARLQVVTICLLRQGQRRAHFVLRVCV